MYEYLIDHKKWNSIYMTVNGMSFWRLACHSWDPWSCHRGQWWLRRAKGTCRSRDKVRTGPSLRLWEVKAAWLGLPIFLSGALDAMGITWYYISNPFSYWCIQTGLISQLPVQEGVTTWLQLHHHYMSGSVNCSVVSDSLWPLGL